VCIFCAILRIQSTEGQKKPSPLAPPISVWLDSYGTAIITYVGPRDGNPKEQKKYLLLFHSLFNPMLNPLIYTLRNSEVKNTLKRMLGMQRGL
jgi:olfactory receptor